MHQPSSRQSALYEGGGGGGKRNTNIMMLKFPAKGPKSKQTTTIAERNTQCNRAHCTGRLVPHEMTAAATLTRVLIRDGVGATGSDAAPNRPALLPIPSMLAAIARASNASSSSIIDADNPAVAAAAGSGVCGAGADADADAGGGAPIPSILAAIARANIASSLWSSSCTPPAGPCGGARGGSAGLPLREACPFGPPPPPLVRP